MLNSSDADSRPPHDELFRELWVSLASLLKSYTSLHGLAGNRTAIIEQDEERILVRHGDKRLGLKRSCSSVVWEREDGRSGTLEWMESGRLRSNAGEEEMDLAAETWARELMQ